MRAGIEDIVNELPDFDDIDFTNGPIIIDQEQSGSNITVYKFNFGLLRSLNKLLAETTVEQYVNSVLGDGAFSKIPDMLSSVLDLTVGDFLEMLEAQGVTLDDVIDALDTVVATQYPDENINTLNELVNYLMQQNGVASIKIDVKQMILMLRDTTVYDLVSMVMQSGNGTLPSKAEIVSQVSTMLNQVRSLTVYGIMSAPDMSANMIKLYVDEAINVMENNFQVRLHVATDGSSKVVFTVVAPEQTVITDKMTEDEQSVAQIFNEFKEQIKNVHGTVTVGTDRLVDTDYAGVKQAVEEAYGAIVIPEITEDRNALEDKLENELEAFSVQFCTSDDGRLLIQVNKVQDIYLDEDIYVNINLMVKFFVDLENPVSISKNGENVYNLNYRIELNSVEELNEPCVTGVDGISHFVEYAMKNWGYSEQEAEEELKAMQNSVVEELVLLGLDLTYNVQTNQFSVIKQAPDAEVTPAE